MRAWPLWPVLLVACTAPVPIADDAVDDSGIEARDTGDTDSTPGVVDDTASDTALAMDDTCDGGLVTTTPSVDDGAVYPHAMLRAVFDGDRQGSTSFTLVHTASGEDVPLSAPRWSGGGRHVWVRPVVPLEPEADHVWVITAPCGTVEEVAFTTSDVGAAVSAGGLAGTNWTIDLAGVEIVEPVALGDVLEPLLAASAERLAFTILSADDDTLSIEAGIAGYDGGAWVQDVCLPTVPLSGVDFSDNPWFDGTDGFLSVPLGPVDVEIFQVALSGGFAASGDGMEGLAVQGVIDTRPLDSALAPGMGAGGVCSLVGVFSGFRVSCGACPDASGPYCLDLVAVGRAQEMSSSFGLQTRTVEQVALDPGCYP